LDFQGPASESWNPPGAKNRVFQECREKPPWEGDSTCPAAGERRKEGDGVSRARGMKAAERESRRATHLVQTHNPASSPLQQTQGKATPTLQMSPPSPSVFPFCLFPDCLSSPTSPTLPLLSVPASALGNSTFVSFQPHQAWALWDLKLLSLSSVCQPLDKVPLVY
jgi:hypothetical protein